MKKLVLSSLAVGCAAGLLALPEPSAFATPQGADRTNTGPLFWLHGTESAARLREYVGRIDDAGQGILTCESRPHKDWMGPNWWRDLEIILGECRTRGMKAMLYDDYWWPSQGMGGVYPIPQRFQCRDIVAKVYAKAAAPAGAVADEIARVTVKETAKDTFALAADGDKVIVYSSCVLDAGHSRYGGFRQPTVNGLDAAAVDWFLNDIYQPHYDHFKELFKDGTIPGFFFDEPETMGWWGPDLAQELAARGENVGELLTAFKFKLADPEAQAKARYRFFDARAHVWGRTMYGRQSAWCRDHGVYSSGHFLEHANDYFDLGRCAGDVLTLMQYVDVPGVDLVCHQYYPNQREDRGRQIAFGQMPKLSSSMAHVFNRHGGLNWCEIFGGYDQQLTYPQMKWLAAWHQYQGCYYLIPHSFNPRAPYDHDYPPYFYNGGREPRYPLFRVWAAFNNRCAMLLSKGEHVCRIAQCVPGMSFHAGRIIRPEMFAFAIQDAQLDSDFVPYNAVEGAVVEKDPRTGRPSLRTKDGREHYDILTLPAAEYVPYATLEKALAFAQAGGVVVGYGLKPSNTPTRGRTAADVQKLVAEIFAQPTALFLDGEPDGAQLRAALAQNYPGTTAPLAVRALDFAGLSSVDGRMLALDQYEQDGDQIFFVVNQDIQRGRDLVVKTALPAARAELWDPLQGTVEKPRMTAAGIQLTLPPNGALFLVWPKTPTSGLLPRVEQPQGAVVAATVKEVVTPVEQDEATGPDALLKGANWIWHPVDREAPGTVQFRTSIDCAAAATADLVFSCDNAAKIRVNGTLVAEQAMGGGDYNGWRTPTQAKVRFAQGRNEITVEGVNPIPGPAGLLAAFRFADGRTLRTDAAWEVARDGKTFVKAAAIAPYGQGPWGSFGKRHENRSPFAESVETTLAAAHVDLPKGARVYLVCDDVAGEQSAAVTVNGSFAGGFIGQPYRLDLTKAVKPGANTVSIKPFRVKNPRLVIEK